MKKKSFLIGALVLSVSTLIGCGAKEISNAQPSEQKPEQKSEKAAYPTKAIDFTVPFKPGGGSDVMARIIEQYWKDEFGVGLNFHYREGAGGAVGLFEFANTAKQDGHAMATYVFPQISLQPASGAAQYKLDDFALIGQVATDYDLLVVPADSPWKTLEDFINDAKNRPGKINLSLSGVNTPAHMSYVQLIDHTGVDVPRTLFQSGSEQLSAILGGHVDGGIGAVGTLMKEVQSGNLRALAISSKERFEDFPDIPTYTEQGYPIVNFASRIFMTRAGVDPAQVERLEKGLENIINNPEAQEKMKNAGLIVEWKNGKEVEAYIREFDKTADQLVKRLKEDAEK